MHTDYQDRVTGGRLTCNPITWKEYKTGQNTWGTERLPGPWVSGNPREETDTKSPACRLQRLPRPPCREGVPTQDEPYGPSLHIQEGELGAGGPGGQGSQGRHWRARSREQGDTPRADRGHPQSSQTSKWNRGGRPQGCGKDHRHSAQCARATGDPACFTQSGCKASEVLRH